MVSADEIIRFQQLVNRVPVSDQVLGYAWALVRSSRPGTPEAPDVVNKWASWGAGPRGVLTLVSCAKARAIHSDNVNDAIEQEPWYDLIGSVEQGIDHDAINELCLMDPLPQAMKFGIWSATKTAFGTVACMRLAQITGELGDHGVSIESVIQRGRAQSGEPVAVVVLIP